MPCLASWQRPVRRWCVVTLHVICLLLSTPIAAFAEAAPASTPAALRGAESAFQAVDLESVYELATRGLRLGGAAPDEAARLHVLAGIAAAALGNDQEAKRHFLAALAMQPTLNLERDLAPKVRDPYLEALGYWGTQTDRLLLRASYDEKLDRLTLRLTDPAALGRRVLIGTRDHGSTEFSSRWVEAKSRRQIDLNRSDRRRGFDYYVALVDEHGNHLVEQGNEDDPLAFTGHDDAVASRHVNAGMLEAGRSHSVWLPVALFGAGLVAGGFGAYFHVRRESYAQQWNDETCEQPGATRLEQCGDVNSERGTMQRLAIGSYALGGALIATGVTLLWVGTGPAKETGRGEHLPACGLGLATLSVGCTGRF